MFILLSRQRPGKTLMAIAVCLTCWQGTWTFGHETKLHISTDQATSISKRKPLIDLTAGIHVTKKWRIVFAVKDGPDRDSTLSPHWKRAWEALRTAGRDFGVRISLLPGGRGCNRVARPSVDCAQWQIRQIIELIKANETDGIVLAATDSNRVVPVVERAISAAIPIVAVDTPVNSDRLLAFVAIDNFESGKAMGEWVGRQLDPGSNVLMLTGSPDEQNAIDRRNGLLTGLKTAGLGLLDIQAANWAKNKAKAATTAWLRKYPRIDAVVASNDEMALGAAEAVRESGRQGIRITGFDAERMALEAIRKGSLTATIDQPVDRHVRLALKLLIHYLETGEIFQSPVLLPETTIITKENVSDYLEN